ncbi:hypothetical protein EMIHUDRAFT_465198 [Emiliania huxleyi CCMP1516]|uniref:Heterokaryon incompatibility domain-containing protein n=3 Tax=Emiliania huxleyi TaxID=2903 RepID=A0A0D3IHB3_EMIH1|nr:hypothetical protein EMIHUDRAFT_465198 [Emiliania huxleyi CCMP1516]EOD10648.1 hypothetical protein EMIHUDRAFT_465198 [Emiliania huxleyi CCMP1516]|eukprot:XP_005763077.1 hypothetical protein EMIHUDRAFT_465198 [Emiliania huxleyi CCMP1516]
MPAAIELTPSPRSCFATLSPWHWLLLTAIALTPTLAAVIALGTAHRLHRSAAERESRASEASARRAQLVKTLDDAQIAEARIRLRVSVPTFALGWALFVFCEDIFSHMCSLVGPSASVPAPMLIPAAAAPILVLLSCRPTDRVAIRCACLFLVARELYEASSSLHYVLSEELVAARAAGWDECSSYHFSVPATKAVLALYHGLFYASSLRLSARPALQRLWLGLRCYFVINALLRLLPKYALAVHFGCSSDGPAYSVLALVYFYGFGLLFSLPLTAQNRGRVHNLLGGAGLDERARRTSAVAALFGRDGFRSTRSRVIDAVSRFKAVRLSALSTAVLGDSAASEDERALLDSHAEQASLGGVDAFISHSWGDDAEAKYRAIEQWSQAFAQAHGRTPLLWLDKACVDQRDIERSLRGLPIFIGGCNHFVVLAGSTYLQRLWCVLEIFCFLSLGGTVSRISVLHLADKGASSGFGGELDASNFKLAQTACAYRKDRDRILAVIEATYGYNKPFDRLVRKLLSTERVSTELGDASTRTTTARTTARTTAGDALR